MSQPSAFRRSQQSSGSTEDEPADDLRVMFSGRGKIVGESSIKQLPLRQRFRESEKLLRDLTEHLDRGFYPKLKQLSRLVRPTETEAYSTDIEDVTIRSHVKGVLESESYTDQLCEKLAQFSDAINDSVSRIVNGE